MSFSPNGELMTAFNRDVENFVIRVKNADGTIPQQFEPTRIMASTRATYVQFSTDGEAIVFQDEGQPEKAIFVATYPDTSRRCPVASGGYDPSWVSNSRQVMYIVGSEARVVDVLSVPDCRIGTPRRLFDGDYPDRPGFSHDVRHDGEEFLMARKIGYRDPTRQLTLLTNVFEELRRLARSAR